MSAELDLEFFARRGSYLPVRLAAVLYPCNPKNIYYLVRRGRVGSVKPFGFYLVDSASLLAWRSRK